MGLLAAAIYVSFLAAARAGRLYGITASSPPTLSLIAVNGSTSAIAPLQGRPLDLVSTLDAASGTYYFVDTATHPAARLVGLSLATGAVVSAVPLPVVIADASTYGGLVIAFAANLGGAVVVAGDDANGTHLVGALDPTSGAWRLVATITAQDSSDETGTGAYIPALRLFVFDLIVYTPHGWVTNFAVNMTSGAVFNRTNPVSRGSQIQQRLLNPADGQLYGIGYEDADDDHPGSPWNRTIERMDPASLAVSVVGVVPGGWGVVVGSAGAIGGGAVFWMAAKGQTVNGSTDFYLVQNSLADASVVSVSAVPMCSAQGFPPACPTSLQYVD